VTGLVIGNYRVIDRLGHGGQGKVYRAIDTMVEREVAIKALRPEIARDPEMLERFRTEAVTLAKLNHPAIAQLYAFFRDGEDFFMVMEYVPGRTLEKIIQEQGPIPWPRAVSIAASILDAIGFAHGLGVLHRDLKPANIMLTPDGRVKVMDFGIAQVLGGRKMTREGRVVGTVEYLAPERIRGSPPDERSDLYSLGIVLYEMLTGRLPFNASSEYAAMMAQLNECPPLPKDLGIDLPEPVVDIVTKALEKNPEQRFAGTASFAAALRAIPAPATAAPLPGSETMRPPSQWPLRWIAAGAGAFLLILLVSLVVLRRVEEDPWKEARTLPPTEVPPAVVEPFAPSAEPPIAFDPAPIPVPSPAPVQTPAVPPRSAKPVQPAPSEPPPRPAPAGEEPLGPPAPQPAPPAAQPVTQGEPPPAPRRRALTSIRDVRSIFVERTEGDLDGYIRGELQYRLGARIGVVRSSSEADAVMRIQVEELKGGTLSRAGRVFGVSDKRRIQARVIDASTGAVLWAERAGDRQILTGAFVGDSAKRLATRIVSELERDLR
jgi:serine/threonine protein kinase